MPIYEYQCDQCGERSGYWYASAKNGPDEVREHVLNKACPGVMRFTFSRVNFNSEFPTQIGGQHSLAGFGKRARFRQGD